VKGNMGAHLHVIHTKYVARSRKYAAVEEGISSSDVDATADTRLAMKRKVRAMQESRVAHVEALRARVRAGTYQVDSTLLAQRILEGGSHFMESSDS